MMTKIERRYLGSEREIRMDEGEDGARRLVHHAPPWGVLSEVLWIDHHEGRELPVREIFERGAFAEMLGEPTDTAGLLNHDVNWLLGRTPVTLSLEEDDIGLRYEIWLPQTPRAKEIIALVERGARRLAGKLVFFSGWGGGVSPRRRGGGGGGFAGRAGGHDRADGALGAGAL